MLPLYPIMGDHERSVELGRELAQIFKSRGLNVAIVDQIDLISGRISLEGSDWSMTISGQGITPTRHGLRQLIPYVPAAVDLVLAAGLESDDFPHHLELEIDQDGAGHSSSGPTVYWGQGHGEGSRTMAFSADKRQELADYIWSKRQENALLPDINLWVNSKRIGLKDFVQQILIKGIVGMISTLKGVERIERVRLSFENGPLDQK